MSFFSQCQKGFTTECNTVSSFVLSNPQYTVGWAQLVCFVLYGDVYALGDNGPEDALDKALHCAHRPWLWLRNARRPVRIWPLFTSCFVNILKQSDTITLNQNKACQVGFSGFLLGLSGDLERSRCIIDEIEKLNLYQPGWMRSIAFFYNLEKGKYEMVLQEARRYRSLEHPWDPLMRAVSAGHLGNEPFLLPSPTVSCRYGSPISSKIRLPRSVYGCTLITGWMRCFKGWTRQDSTPGDFDFGF